MPESAKDVIICELCYREQDKAKAHTWKLILQSFFCPLCYERGIEEIGGIHGLRGGCYAEGRPDPRTESPTDKAKSSNRGSGPDYPSHGIKNYVPDTRRGHTTMPVLEFLWGKEWNELTHNYVQALQCDAVQVIPPNGEMKSDAWLWRVTVFIDPETKIIDRIEQEVEVGLRGATCGHDLNCQVIHDAKPHDGSPYVFFARPPCGKTIPE